MRNILVYVPQKEKKSFAEALKEIWLAPTAELARKRFSALNTGWKILWPSMHSPCWMRERFHLPT